MNNSQNDINNLEAKVRELSDALANNGDAGTMSGWIPGGAAGGGFTGTVTSIGVLNYSSGSLQYKVKTATYTNGLLTAEPTLGDWVTLFTGVTGCPS
jgi:hypothetical protein